MPRATGEPSKHKMTAAHKPPDESTDTLVFVRRSRVWVELRKAQQYPKDRGQL